ncbi:MAG: bacillithiol biosynthesis BshC [Planctomycetota bacterium]
MADILASDPEAALLEGSHGGSIDPSGAALLFQLHGDERYAWRLAPGGLREDGSDEVLSPNALAERIRQEPERWSAGALLRPIVQDLVLPNVAYVGGLGELQYHLQVVEVRRRMNAPITAFAPRVSITQVDPESQASLDKGGFTLEQVILAKGELEPEDENLAIPPVFAEIRAILDEAQAALRGKRKALAEVEPSLDSGLRRAADQMGQGIEKVLDKALRIHQNKGGTGKRHARRLNNRLMPRGVLQERVLGPIEFYARYGHAWLEAFIEAVPALSHSHLALTLIPDETR